MFKPSEYQSQIFDFIKRGRGNLVINAVAGSGKTTTIIECLKFIEDNKKVLFLAFNKKIVSELKDRVPSHVSVKTLHSFGWSALKRHYNLPFDSKPKENKIQSLVLKLKKSWRELEKFEKSGADDYCNNIIAIVEKMRLTLTFNEDEVELLAKSHGIYPVSKEIKRAKEVLEIADLSIDTFDFTDMVYRPYADNIRVFQYDWVFVDECQDLNKAQQELLKRIIKPITGRFVAVGDPSQAIYGFAGADVDSFQKLQLFKNTKTLPLSFSYRCGKRIVEYAQTITSDIKYGPNNPEGLVRRDGHFEEIVVGDWVLCRNFRPLARMCMQLILSDKKANIIGIDFGMSLANMLKKKKSEDIQYVLRAINADFENLKDKLFRAGYRGFALRSHPALIEMGEKIQVLMVLCDGLNSVSDVCFRIESIFRDKAEKCVTLCTMHRSKGLESDRVFIVRMGLLPSKYAIEDWQIQQERNLLYVAITRAKNELIIIPESNWNDLDYEES